MFKELQAKYSNVEFLTSETNVLILCTQSQNAMKASHEGPKNWLEVLASVVCGTCLAKFHAESCGGSGLTLVSETEVTHSLLTGKPAGKTWLLWVFVEQAVSSAFTKEQWGKKCFLWYFVSLPNFRLHDGSSFSELAEWTCMSFWLVSVREALTLLVDLT